MNFTDLGLSPEVLKAVDEVGYEVPTPIQAKAIPYVLMGRDVLGCAQTGTGKTASFTLPMIEILASTRTKARMPRSLILCPTRELAAQVADNFELYGKYHKLTMALLTGGTSLGAQEKKLDRGVQVLIATPGRLLDLFERGKILLVDVKILVIDEADRMLDMGFMPDVERIVGLLPKIRQTLFFSATMPPEIRRLSSAFLMNPKEIAVDPPASPAETVTQALLKVTGAAKEKRAALRSILKGDDVASALVFCNRKRDVDVVHRSLTKHGFSNAALHGDMVQSLRTETLAAFKDGKIKVLVCSDVAARGLDIPAVSHVINFDAPINPEDYIHRIGRTGRAGRSGKSVLLVHPEEAKSLANIQRLINRELPELEFAGVERWSEGAVEPSGGRRRRGGRSSKADASPRNGKAPSDNTKTAAVETESAQVVESLPERREKKRKASSEKPRRNATRAPKAPAISAEEPSVVASVASTSFGDHTPAFILRPVA